MQLRKARVTNFKIVEDSTEFTLDRVTCLVGKNESGKTALLEALYRLSPYYKEDAKYDKVEEYPRRYFSDYAERHPNGDAPVISTTWELEDADVTAVEAVLGPNALKSREVVIHKGYDETGTTWNVPVDEKSVLAHLIAQAELHMEEAEPASQHKTVADLKKYLEAKALQISDREQKISLAIDKFRDGSVFKAAIDALRLPKFVSFSDYDYMSGNVAIDDLLRRKGTNDPKQIKPGEKVFFAFLGLVGTTLEEINQINKFEPLKARLEAASNKITRDVFKYWTQNQYLRVQFTLDAALPGDEAPFNQGKILHTRIYNTLHDVSVNFDERSRGFVWFFSFLVLFSQVKKNYGRNVIILLDEPGLSLHAKAQGDLLQYIEEQLKPDHQVIYSTHSPFMVDPNNLMSARTVEDVVIYEENNHQPKEILGTKVGSDVLSTDRDTLFPLQGALGYEITQTLFVGKNSILVEGPSDLLYITVFSAELKRLNRTYLDPRWTITPVGGVDKVAAFISLLSSGKLHIAVLVDYAHGQKKKVEDLRRSKILQDNHVLTFDMFTEKPEADIEDVIGWTNYMQLVNATYGLAGGNQLRDAESPNRVLTKVEERFGTMPPEIPEFDHYAPAEYAIKNREEILAAMPDLDGALGRFEGIFKALNAMLPPKK